MGICLLVDCGAFIYKTSVLIYIQWFCFLYNHKKQKLTCSISIFHRHEDAVYFTALHTGIELVTEYSYFTKYLFKNYTFLQSNIGFSSSQYVICAYVPVHYSIINTCYSDLFHLKE